MISYIVDHPKLMSIYLKKKSEVGYVNQNNLVGKAQILFFSSNPRKGSIFNILKWNEIVRFERFFNKII